MRNLSLSCTIIPVIKYPLALSLRARQVSMVQNLHPAPHQYFASDFRFQAFGQMHVICVSRISSPFNLDQHHIPSAFPLFEMYLKFTANPVHPAQHMTDLAWIDIYCPVYKHIIRTAEDPIMHG